MDFQGIDDDDVDDDANADATADDDVDDVDDDGGDLSQSSFFLLSLGVLQRFFPLHSFLPFHLIIHVVDDDDGGDVVDDDGGGDEQGNNEDEDISIVDNDGKGWRQYL